MPNQPTMINPYPHFVTIDWGSDKWRAEDPDAPDPETYRFATKAELDAFTNGVAEMDGWMGYEITEDSRDDRN